MANREDSSTRSWNSAADDWVAHADSSDYHNLFLMPKMLEMIGDARARNVLDVGCGEGGYSRELTRRGARVTGVDGSARLIEVARERAGAEGLNVEYIYANASAMDEVASGSFDLVMTAMSLMNIEDYSGAVRECFRVLKTDGELLMSITHPCFSAPVSEWIKGDAGEMRYYAVDRYFERTAWEDRITPKFRLPTIRRHQPLGDYMDPLLQAGFALREFQEPCATAEDVKRSARFAHMTRVPYFLFMRWNKE